METCKDKDANIALEAIHNYNETTRKTQVQGITLELNAEIVANAFDLLREPVGKKEQKLTDIAITNIWEKLQLSFLTGRIRSRELLLKDLARGRVFRFIAEAIAMKGTSTYISEGLFGKCLGKATKGYHLDMAREIADSTISQMQNVKTQVPKIGKVWTSMGGTFQAGNCLSSGKP